MRPQPTTATVSIPVPVEDRIEPLRDYRDRPFEAVEVRYRLRPASIVDAAIEGIVVVAELTAYGEPNRNGYLPRRVWRAGYDADRRVVWREQGTAPAWLPRPPAWWEAVVSAFVEGAAS